MAVEFGSNFITGITTATSDTDVAYKEYADGKPGYALTATPVIGEYYKGDVDVVTSTVGLNTTFVYDTAGSYTYPIDSSASSLSLYITGSGGGGSESTSDSTYSPTGFEWGSVCSSLSIWSYGCKVFASNDSIVIAASQTGKGIETSNNALDWTARTIGVSYANSSLIYANNLFVYGSCYYGEIATSTDAIHWDLRTSACGCGSIPGLAYGNNLWFADSSCCAMAASTDAIHWELRTVPQASQRGCRNSAVFGEGLFLRGGMASFSASTDTIHWELRTLGTNQFYTTNLNYINGEFIAVQCSLSDWNIAKSTDSIHWQKGGCGNLLTSRIPPAGSSYCVIRDVTKIANNSLYFAAGECSMVSTSTDFVNWRTKKIKDAKLWRNSCCSWNYGFGNLHKLNISGFPNRFLMGGYYYNSLSVAEPEIMGLSGVGGAASGSFLYDISLENVSKKEGLTICVGSGGKGGGKSWNVSNCSNWTARTVGIQNNCHVFDIAFNQGKFVAVGCGKLLTTSTDAIHWTQRTIGEVQSASSLTSVIYDYENWLVTGCGATNLSYGSLSASTDSIHWSQRTTGIPDDHVSIFYNSHKGTYLINSKACSIASSTDAIHWDLRTIGSTDNQIAEFIGYGSGYYIAGGGQHFSSSTDAIHWFKRTVGNDGGTGNAASNNAFAYMHPNYVLSMNVSGNCALISTSTDTINWTIRTGCQQMGWYSGIQTKMNTINGEIYRHNTTNGTTVSSTDTIHWEYKPLPSSGSFSNQFPAFAYGNGKFLKSYSAETTGFCMSSFDATASSGCNTTVSWYNGFPANVKGCVYPLKTSSNAVSKVNNKTSYCFAPDTQGYGEAFLKYNSTDFRLSTSNTSIAPEFTVEFYFRAQDDQHNCAEQTIFAIGEFQQCSSEGGAYRLHQDAGGYLRVYLCTTNNTLRYQYTKSAGGVPTSGSFGLNYTDNCWNYVKLQNCIVGTTGCLVYTYTNNADNNIYSGSIYNTTSDACKLVVYGDTLCIGSSCHYTGSPSTHCCFPLNGEITNFRISNCRVTSYLPDIDLTPSANTVFLTGRGESFNGSSGSQSCINIPGAAGASIAGGPGLGYEYSSLNLSMYSSLATGINCRGGIACCSPPGSNGNCDYKSGFSDVDACNCCSHGSSTGGGAGGLSKGEKNELGGKSNFNRPISTGGCLPDVENNRTGVGRGGNGGDVLYNFIPGSFTLRTGVNSCYICGGAYVNNYYLLNNCASTDTIHWELRTVPNAYVGGSYRGYMMDYNELNPTEAIMYTCTCELYHTTDSIHWRLRTTPFGKCGSNYDYCIMSVNHMSNNEWSVSGCKLISISTDTIHWLLRTAGGCSGGHPMIKGVVYGNNKYMAAGHCCQYISTSSDSIHWQLRTRACSGFDGDSNPYNPAFGNGMFVITSYNSVSYSTDAIHWKGCCYNCNTHYSYGMKFHRGLNSFLATSYYGWNIMSGDGINWSQNSVLDDGGCASQGYASLFLGGCFFNSNSCLQKGVGYIMTADSIAGTFSGSDGETGAGGGGGGYLSAMKESTSGGSGGDAYVRINWK